MFTNETRTSFDSINLGDFKDLVENAKSAVKKGEFSKANKIVSQYNKSVQDDKGKQGKHVWDGSKPLEIRCVKLPSSTLSDLEDSQSLSKFTDSSEIKYLISSPRILNCFKEKGIENLYDLSNFCNKKNTEELLDSISQFYTGYLSESPLRNLLNLPNFGAKCHNNLIRVLEEVGPRSQEDVLLTKVEDLDFSKRLLSSLSKANIKFLGDLIQLSEDDLLNLESFGERSLYEVKDVVASFSLNLPFDLNESNMLKHSKLEEGDSITINRFKSEIVGLGKSLIVLEDGSVFEITLSSDLYKDILMNRIFKDKKVSLQTLGDKYGLTRERVRQIESKLYSSFNSLGISFIEIQRSLNKKDHSDLRDKFFNLIDFNFKENLNFNENYKRIEPFFNSKENKYLRDYISKCFRDMYKNENRLSVKEINFAKKFIPLNGFISGHLEIRINEIRAFFYKFNRIPKRSSMHGQVLTEEDKLAAVVHNARRNYNTGKLNERTKELIRSLLLIPGFTLDLKKKSKNRNFEDVMKEIYNFVLENKRYPSQTANDKEEKYLATFRSQTKVKLKKGLYKERNEPFLKNELLCSILVKNQ